MQPRWRLLLWCSEVRLGCFESRTWRTRERRFLFNKLNKMVFIVKSYEFPVDIIGCLLNMNFFLVWYDISIMPMRIIICSLGRPSVQNTTQRTIQLWWYNFAFCLNSLPPLMGMCSTVCVIISHSWRFSATGIFWQPWNCCSNWHHQQNDQSWNQVQLTVVCWVNCKLNMYDWNWQNNSWFITMESYVSGAFGTVLSSIWAGECFKLLFELAFNFLFFELLFSLQIIFGLLCVVLMARTRELEYQKCNKYGLIQNSHCYWNLYSQK